MFNEKNSKDEIIINLLEQINNPVEYMMFNLFLEPSSLYWCGKIFEIKHNVILSTEKIKLYSYKKQEQKKLKIARAIKKKFFDCSMEFLKTLNK